MPVDDASQLIDALVEREVPLVWKIGDKRRVLDTSLKAPDKTLLLLHGCVRDVAASQLCAWVEYNDLKYFKRDVLKRLHMRKLIEYDADAATAIISPSGVAHVERKLLTAIGE
jgi:hypothetical protein